LIPIDQSPKPTDNIFMSIDTSTMAELQEAADRAAKGIRDPDAMRKALARLAVAREELRKRVGILDVSVDLIRSARDQ
jgi:hypothetical protein